MSSGQPPPPEPQEKYLSYTRSSSVVDFHLVNSPLNMVINVLSCIFFRLFNTIKKNGTGTS